MGNAEGGRMPGGLSYGAIGAAYGLVVQLYANGLRRVPALRRPWEHMIMMGIGAYGMNYIGQYTIKAQEEYDANQDKQRRANAMRYT